MSKSKLNHLQPDVNNTTNHRIEHLRELLGPAVLLPWPAGSKGGRRKWGDLQLTDMNEATHLAKLQKAGNIGVALGKVSDGLVTIDVDEKGYIEPFLDANPLARDTLRTCASRGCNIWLRCRSAYPRSCKLTDPSKKEIGEWRADGNQTIISGTHPSGVPYQFVVDKPVITIDYEDIVWPDDFILPPDATESQRVRGVKGVREKEVIPVCVPVSVPMCVSAPRCEQIQAYVTSDLMLQIAPRECHRNNASLFKLARLVKSYENAVGRPATTAELEFVFDRWCLNARRFWRSELTRDDYYAEFLEACSYARIGLDENPIEVAVSRARRGPLPEVRGFTDERIRLLVAICRELQVLTDDSPFFLPTRKVGEILGVHYTQAARWLKAVEFLGVIYLAPGEIRSRGGNRSPRYHYGSPQRTTRTVLISPPPGQSALRALTDGNESGNMEDTARGDAEMHSDLISP